MHTSAIVNDKRYPYNALHNHGKFSRKKIFVSEESKRGSFDSVNE